MSSRLSKFEQKNLLTRYRRPVDGPSMEPAVCCKCKNVHSTTRRDQCHNNEAEITHSDLPEVVFISELSGFTIPVSAFKMAFPAEMKPKTSDHLTAEEVGYVPEPHIWAVHETTGTTPDLSEASPVGSHLSLGTPTSPPPAYTLLHDGGSASDYEKSTQQIGPAEDAMVVTGGSLTPNPTVEENDIWVDPITSACRKIMRTKFSSPTITLFDDYSQYREHVRTNSKYRWYLDFQYLSLILQPELAAQVFLVNLQVSRAEASTEINALLFLFEDCIVFAHSNTISYLPDPNSSREVEDFTVCATMTADNGLEILEDVTIKFNDLLFAYKERSKHLVLDVTMDEKCTKLSQEHNYAATECMRYILRFKTTCQRHKVFEAMSLWNSRNEEATCSRTYHGGRSNLRYSSTMEPWEPDLDNNISIRPRRCQYYHSHSYEITSRSSDVSMCHHEKRELFDDIPNIPYTTTPRSMPRSVFDLDLEYRRASFLPNAPDIPFRHYAL